MVTNEWFVCGKLHFIHIALGTTCEFLYFLSVSLKAVIIVHFYLMFDRQPTLIRNYNNVDIDDGVFFSYSQKNVRSSKKKNMPTTSC